MTTEIEKQFFECFGIEKQDVKMPYGEWEYFYPEITAEKLLELLCIVIDEYNHNGHNFSLDAIGDFTAISIDEYTLLVNYGDDHPPMAAHHAGGTKEESQLYLFAIKLGR